LIGQVHPELEVLPPAEQEKIAPRRDISKNFT
jgi:hypothetical protein